MTDVAREKYLKLMTEIEDIEDDIEQLKKKSAPADDIIAVQELLAVKRNELARISDGCGHSHSMNC